MASKIWHIVNRYDWILSQISSLDRVAHFGCVGDDWGTRQFDSLWEETEPLHAALEGLVGKKRLIGFDVNKEGIDRLADRGFAVVYGNAEEPMTFMQTNRPFDVVVAGDMVEHLTMPGVFLEGVKLMVEQKGRLVITTPNAFGFWHWFCFGLLGQKETHPEHTCVYTPLMLENVLTRHGWRIVEIKYMGMEKWYKRRFKWVKKLPEYLPRLRPIIGVVAEKV